MGRKFYVVWNGWHTGVFDSWDDAKEQVTGYPDARYKSFTSQEAAIEAYRGDPSEHIGIIKSIVTHKAPIVNYQAFPEIHLDALAVDAACSHNPGPVEYQGVVVGTGERIFHVGPMQGGSNNLGEFLALVHALALLNRDGFPDRPIYTDSVTARAWVRNRKAKTTITPNSSNAQILNLVSRAEAWLATHTYRNPILKWDTQQWGEIPADFGRKNS